jgi:signal transduction histidine kinase
VEVEELAPPDPFNIPAKRVEDLLLFDPNGKGLHRIKVKGQIELARRGQYCLQDGKAGIRVQTKRPLLLRPGDLIEAVGFLRFGGPSPILLEAVVRTNGSSFLQAPVSIAGTELPNHSHDSTRVRVEAMLLDDRIELDDRILELQAEKTHFTARIKSLEPKSAQLAAGCRLQLTGVYVSAGDEQASGNLDPFELDMNSPSEIQVLQRAPWWTKRRSFILVGFLAGLLAIVLIWIKLLRRKIEERTAELQKEIEERQLVEQRELMEQERTRVAQDLHDELGAGLTEMGLLGDLAKNPALPAPEKQQYLAQLSNTARSLVASLDEIVWAINPQYDSVADLASYFALFAQRFLDLSGVACRPHIPTYLPELPLDSKERHSLFLAFKEALNNVVRHSGAGEVSLKIEAARGQLTILVADNGHGFETSAGPPGGDGVQGMRHRLEQLGGSCNIRSQPGGGTEVELRLPVGNHSL